MTHAELVERAGIWLRRTKRCPIVATELTTSTSETPDAIGWHAIRGSYLVECKISREDYYADKAKLFRRYPDQGLGEFRYYMTPPGLLVPSGLPEGWGLLEVRGQRVHVVRESAHPEHRWQPPFTANHRAEKVLLISIMRRHRGEYTRPCDRTTIAIEPEVAPR